MSWSPFANPGALRAAIAAALLHLVPPPDLAPSAWAESENGVRIALGNAIPGPIRFDNAPYQRGMIDAAAEPGIQRITLMAGAQTGKTTVLQCIQAYFIAHEPRSQMVMFPSQGDLQVWLDSKFRPMVDANPRLQQCLAKPRGRAGVNNSRMISYPGGAMMFAWAGSPKTMRGRSAPVISVDEVDGMTATEEGDPVQLLWQRAATFGDQRLLLESSTPTIKGASRIESGFEQGDRRRFWVGCPHCGEFQTLKWSQVSWIGRDTPEAEQQPETAAYVCEACAVPWGDGDRVMAIREAEALGGGWRAERPFRGHASFHINELYSCFRNLRDIVQSYLDKIAVGDLQSFVNVSLAETFEEVGEQADAKALEDRCEEFPAAVPAGGLVLTAGIDMQPDRLEVEVVAWGNGEESWSVDYQVLWGDPDRGEVWEDLDDVLATRYRHESGKYLSIKAAALDTGGTGGNTQSAYEYARGKTGRRLFAVKGQGGWGRPIVAAPSRKQSGKTARKVDLFLVGTDEAKLTVMRRLAITKPGPGYCHFPVGRDPEYFAQLGAEKLVTKFLKGFPAREWHKTRDRNEALDCRQYALAALKIINPSFRRAAARLQPKEATTGPVTEAADDGVLDAPENPRVAQPPPETETRPKRAVRKRARKSTWATSW